MLAPNGYTTILFDLDGTLRHSVPHGSQIFLEFAASLGAPSDPDSQRRAQQWAHSYWANSEELVHDVKTYDREDRSFWSNYAYRQLLSLQISETQARQWTPLLNQHMEANYAPQDYIPDDVYPTLTALRQAGYTLGVVTNRSNPIDEYMVEIGLADRVDFYFTAGEIGTWKPKPEIFHHALKQATAEAHQAIYVGDNYYADIVGARNVNIQPVLIDPDNVFPDADCPVIKTLGELQTYLIPNA